jgi:hypothetical protein
MMVIASRHKRQFDGSMKSDKNRNNKTTKETKVLVRFSKKKSQRGHQILST